MTGPGVPWTRFCPAAVLDRSYDLPLGAAKPARAFLAVEVARR
jgi:hypothetical protein